MCSGRRDRGIKVHVAGIRVNPDGQEMAVEVRTRGKSQRVTEFPIIPPRRRPARSSEG